MFESDKNNLNIDIDSKFFFAFRSFFNILFINK